MFLAEENIFGALDITAIDDTARMRALLHKEVDHAFLSMTPAERRPLTELDIESWGGRAGIVCASI